MKPGILQSGVMKKNELERIVRTAGTILLEDMQLMAYDTTVFPPSDNLYSYAEEMVPHTLKAPILFQEKRGEKSEKEVETYCSYYHLNH
ncbi:hypothetical protein AVEN_222005-1 [Araneus ventricosus]|uniref:Uncharacterized protein n=1 Tax=Araneus ventricosus TaxID=182803 RepID=A0A4Y2TEN7_ARAVE|nr:hypothetical protein AVEN_222005-1 [Araneus ventricosus]